MTQELKLCVECGGEPYSVPQCGNYSRQRHEKVACICQECGASTGYKDTSEEAIAAWNTRTAPDEARALRSTIFEVLRRHDVSEQCFAEVAMITQAYLSQQPAKQFAENAKCSDGDARALLERVLRCRYPVCTSINTKGRDYDLSRLDEVLSEVEAYLSHQPKETDNG